MRLTPHLTYPSIQNIMSKNKTNRLGSLLKRLPGCIDQGVGILVRVSSDIQLLNVGSITWQEEQIQFLKQYGVKVDNFEVFAGAESAKGKRFRPQFERLLSAIRAGRIGLVLVADVDRNARNETDSCALYDALAEVGGLVAERGQLYDPRDHSHRMFLRIRSAIAEYDNDNRSLKMNSGRAMLARDLRYPVALPTGLLWADPESPVYIAAAKKAGLLEFCSEDALERQQVGFIKGDRVLRILPYPDEEVRLACQLVLEWLIQTRSLTATLGLITSDPRYPYPGCFPVTPSYIAQFDSAEVEIPPVRWNRVVDVEDGREELGRARIFNWCQSPALFGIYAFESKQIADLLPESIPSSIWKPNAFLSLMPPENYARVMQIVKTKRTFQRKGKAAGVRCHAIPQVICSQPLSNGKVCGRVLSIIYPSVGVDWYEMGHFYTSAACGQRGHSYKLRKPADDALIRAVLKLFTRDRIRKELDLIGRRSGVSAELLAKLKREAEELRTKAEWALEQAFSGRSEKDTAKEAKWLKNNDKWEAAATAKEREKQDAVAASDREAEVTRREYDQILALAEDLPELIRRAQEHDDVLAELMSEIVSVVRARRVGWAVYELEIEFHSGAIVHELVVIRTTGAPQPLVLLAKEKLGKWADPQNRKDYVTEQEALEVAEDVARELNELSGKVGRNNWRALRVFSAVLTNSAKPSRSKSLRPLPEFCEEHDLEESLVIQHLLAGNLGDADLRDGVFWISPKLKQVHYVFPKVARRYAAGLLDAPVEDVALVTRLAKDFKKRPDTLWHNFDHNGFTPVKDAYGRAYSTRTLCKRLLGR